MSDIQYVSKEGLERMKQELYYSQNFQYTLRGEKEFEIPESPLIQIGWWRIVMDEAQFIESPVAQSAKMASRLSTCNKWCVTGTPIGKHGLEDLFGLMLFLNFEPFCQRKVWKELIEERYNKGNNSELVSLLRKIMWRHKKIHVEDELVLPPIHYHKVEQTFSPIEEEYYNRLLQESHYMVLQNGAVDEVSAKWALIEKLRQACCHPQVSKDTSRHLLGTALEAQVFGMSEILNSMLSRSQDEVNASERELCRSLNRLAQFYKRFDNLELAEEAWIEAWRIEDGGID
jgi:E3 ubiquitin-protein ligase SHPRH